MGAQRTPHATVGFFATCATHQPLAFGPMCGGCAACLLDTVRHSLHHLCCRSCLLIILQEWDIGSAAAAASASTQQQLDELRAQLDERNARLDEQARQLDEQRRQLDEQRRDLDERQAREEAGQAALADLRKQLVRGCVGVWLGYGTPCCVCS